MTKLLQYLLIGLFIAGFVISENSSAPLINNALTNNVILQLSVAGVGMIGLGIAWKWELIGGIVALSGFVIWCIDNPSTLQNYFVFIYPIIAILFIVLWAICRNTTVKNN